jgi:hypothetical protein
MRLLPLACWILLHRHALRRPPVSNATEHKTQRLRASKQRREMGTMWRKRRLSRRRRRSSGKEIGNTSAIDTRDWLSCTTHASPHGPRPVFLLGPKVTLPLQRTVEIAVCGANVILFAVRTLHFIPHCRRVLGIFNAKRYAAQPRPRLLCLFNPRSSACIADDVEGVLFTTVLRGTRFYMAICCLERVKPDTRMKR